MMINNLLAFSDVIETVFGVIVALLVLLLTITVHEFGHYLVGKLLKFKIEEFAIGMGPAIYKKKRKNGEIFSIRIFPLGGFCAFEGEDDAGAPGRKKESAPVEVYDEYKEDKPAEPAQEKKLSENAFNNKKPWQRILVLIAGGVTNIIFAVIVIAITFSIYGHFTLSVGSVNPGESSLEQAHSLAAGDKILEVNGNYIYLTTDFLDALAGKKKGDKVEVLVERNGERVTLTDVVLRRDVSPEGMTDYYDAFDALGVGTTLIIDSKEDSPFTHGAYITAQSDGTAIYDLKGLFAYLSGYGDGDEVTLKAVVNGESKDMTFVIPEGFDAIKTDYAALNDEEKKAYKDQFKALFKINNFYISYDIDSQNVRMDFFEGLLRAPVYGLKTMWTTLRSLFGLFNGTVSVSDISGPVGTISITSEYVKLGFNYVLEIMALIGISIGVFNLMPLPALDGGRVVFVVIEWIRGKPINRNVEATIHFVGIIALLAFAIIVDLLKLF